MPTRDTRSAARPRHNATRVRGSVLLRQLLRRNPRQSRFTLAHILTALGDDSPAASMMVMSLPGVVPMPGARGLDGLPALRTAAQMMKGKSRVRLPASMLKRSVPRRALALAIHVILPILERCEKLARPRLLWLTAPGARKVIGLLLFLIALPLALPVLGFGIAHAASLFTVSIGLIENDGLVVALGLVLGFAALALLVARTLSLGGLRDRALAAFKTCIRKVWLFKRVIRSALKRLLISWWVDLLERPTRGMPQAA